jgi:hypothetical protein
MSVMGTPGEFDLVYLVCNTIGNVTTRNGLIACLATAARHRVPAPDWPCSPPPLLQLHDFLTPPARAA